MKENLKKMILLIIVFSSIILMLIISCPTPPLFNTTYKVKVYCNHLVDTSYDISVNLWSNSNSDYNFDYINSNNLLDNKKTITLTTNSSDVTFTDVMFPVYVFAWWDASGDNHTTFNLSAGDKSSDIYERDSTETSGTIIIDN